jgi:putative membrane protein
MREPPQGSRHRDPGTFGPAAHPIAEGRAAASDGEGAPGKENQMLRPTLAAAAVIALAAPAAALAQAAKPNDAQIAHIAYTAGEIDIAAANQALKKSHDKQIRGFAEEMVRDHTAVNKQALALVKKLHVTPQANPTSASLQAAASAKLKDYAKLSGKAFDKAYIANEVAYHQTVNGALKDTLIPNAQNAELKSFLGTGLKLFQEHQQHVATLAAGYR